MRKNNYGKKTITDSDMIELANKTELRKKL